jgi:hypothetical protein
MTALTALKMAVVAPIPTPRVSNAIAVKPGLRARVRNP